MKLQTSVSFETDIPDDSEEGPSGDITRPTGRNVALVVRGFLSHCGFDVSDPQQLEDYGWEFEVRSGGAKILFIVQVGPGGPLSLRLDSRNTTALLRRLVSSDSTLQHRHVLEKLNEALLRDGRFRQIRWLTGAP